MLPGPQPFPILLQVHNCLSARPSPPSETLHRALCSPRVSVLTSCLREQPSLTLGNEIQPCCRSLALRQTDRCGSICHRSRPLSKIPPALDRILVHSSTTLALGNMVQPAKDRPGTGDWLTTQPFSTSSSRSLVRSLQKLSDDVLAGRFTGSSAHPAYVITLIQSCPLPERM